MMMRALTQFDYVGRRLYAGDVFAPASDNDGHVLTMAQLAVEIDDDDPPKKRHRYKHRKMQAEDE